MPNDAARSAINRSGNCVKPWRNEMKRKRLSFCVPFMVLVIRGEDFSEDAKISIEFKWNNVCSSGGDDCTEVSLGKETFDPFKME